MGRPDKLTDAVADHIVEDIRDGMPMRWAAVRARIGEKTLHRWMERGEEAEKAAEEGGEDAVAEEDRKYRTFRQRVLLARGELLSEALKVKRQHVSAKNPKVSGPASTFVLTQMFSSDFSTKTQVEATGKDGAPIAVDAKVAVSGNVAPLIDPAEMATWSPEKLAAFAEGLAKGLVQVQDDSDNEEG